MFPNRPTKFHLMQQVCKPGAPAGDYLIISKDGISLTLREEDIRSSRVQDVSHGIGQFRAVEVFGVLVFLFRFGMGRWHRVFYHRGSFPNYEIPAMERLSIRVLLVDRYNGWLKAVRDEKLSFSLSSMIISCVLNPIQRVVRHHVFYFVGKVYVLTLVIDFLS